MPADRLLETLLRSLQTYTEQQDTPRVLGTASSLLTTLTNPLNITLLTSQLLSAPAIWGYPQDLRLCMRCLSVFHSAAQGLIRHEAALQDQPTDQFAGQTQHERTLPREDWIRAVVSGADQRSPRWRHLLVIGGLLLGFGNAEDENISRGMRRTLETALVTATNAVLENSVELDDLGEQTITVVLNHCFPTLSDHERTRLDYDLLLPVLMRATLHSSEGLRSAYFLSAVDMDVRSISATQFRWPEHSKSFQSIQATLSSPLVASLGPLARLIGHSIEQARQSWLVTAALDDTASFARTLYLQWRQTKLSEIDASEENIFLDHESLNKTIPALWKLLRSTLFAVVIILRSAIGRLLGDSTLAGNDNAPLIGTQALHTLRYLYFISSRQGSTTFSQYTFVYLTAIDVLATYEPQSKEFIQGIRPAELGRIPEHPLDRSLDLFFLNTSEHFTLILPSQMTENILVAAAAPYLVAGGNNNLLPIFEAAHSVMLAAFSAAHNVELTARHLPFYVETLFNVFPSNLSARQFRLAFKSLLTLTTPPSPLSNSQPLLSETLLEVLHERARHASTVPLFPHPSSASPDATPEDVMELSEQAILALTILDTLSQLPLHLLEEWLPLSADMINAIPDNNMRGKCKEHLWHMLVDGEMDPDRSQVCHAWWSTRGGRELILYYGQDIDPEQSMMMSGALPDTTANSKL